ncbi:malonyl-CoA O-methyltransferase [Humidesulfovibrio mexicanus]|jgi:malonyl-CoA O-methyltransferase|uniref:Malonyl-CoA O-methyltransferase n=1 Tax=Humidesulfovibrio mexicanus TaxID=147047 RepID=A0A238XRA6_9BACT|nr:methyltransferase domain-containing protein [Humidesulfovibrio mexicanus]SNR61525.1 malonyl-CoA O-methyltransferase [Humidesulfovibrio mexicanus]
MAFHDPTLSRSAQIARSFGARAAQYDEHALLQRQTAQTLADFIARNGGLPGLGLVAEVGCGTGLLSILLAREAQRYLATDIAPEMLARCTRRLGDLDHVAFAVMDGGTPVFPESPAAIVSNLAAQWFEDPVGGLTRLALCAPCLFFAVPLAGSFPEWREAFQDIGRQPGLLPMPKSGDILRALTTLPGRRTRFATESHCLRYPNARAFADSFRNIGADKPRDGYRPAPIKPVFERFAQGMESTAFVLYGMVKQEGA